jgi:hypothetical protein
MESLFQLKRWRSTGVWALGAQVALTEGRRLNPLVLDVGPSAAGVFYLGQSSLARRAIASSSRSTARRAGPLATPAHLSQNTPQMAGVIAHPRLVLDHLGHTPESPHVGGVSVGQWPLRSSF